MSTAAPRASLVQHALLLEYGTVGWNIVEGIVAVAAALSSGSIALLGFGVDSFVETSSGAVMLWRFRPRPDRAAEERAEARALRLVGISLLPFADRTFGWVYLTGAVVLGAEFVLLAVRLVRDTSPPAARRLFLYSLAYLALLFVIIGLDRARLS